MARTKKQVLINFHSSGKTNQLPVSQLEYGEIAVRHHSDKPELYIKTGNDAYATFIDSAKTQSMIDSAVSTAKTNLEGQIGNLNTNVTTLSGAVESLSANVETTLGGYVTTGALNEYKDVVTGNIETAKNEAIGSASAYTDGKVSAAQTTLERQIDAVSTALTAASANIETTIAALADRVDGVEDNYVKTTAYTAYTAATETAYKKAADDAKDAAIAAVSGYANTSINVLKTSLEGQIGDVVADVEALSGVVETMGGNITETLKDYVTTGALNEYKDVVTGDIATAKSEAIGSASAYTDGKVSTVQTNLDNTNTALGTLSGRVDTIVGNDSGKSARAIAAEEAAAAVKLVVSGASETFDTLKEVEEWINTHADSAATMMSDITELKASATSANTRLTTAENDIDKAEADIKALSGAVETKYATSAATVNAISAVDAKFGGYATSAATVDAINAVDAKFGGYATSAATVDAINAEATARQNADDALSGRISTLEGLTGATNSAIQTIVVENSGTNKITATKNGTEVTFNFDDMVIDGGEW